METMRMLVEDTTCQRNQTETQESCVQGKSKEIIAESNVSDNLRKVLEKHLKTLCCEKRVKVLCEFLVTNDAFCKGTLKNLIETPYYQIISCQCFHHRDCSKK